MRKFLFSRKRRENGKEEEEKEGEEEEEEEGVGTRPTCDICAEVMP